MTDIFMFGLQGCGKGTQAKILAKKFDFKIFETGKELRKIARTNSSLGKKIAKIQSLGNLVPDRIVLDLVADFISKHSAKDRFIFDGIPRKEIQRQGLEKLLQKNSRDFTVIEIQISRSLCLSRLLSRGKCQTCDQIMSGKQCPNCGSTKIIRRADDNRENIQKRIANYFAQTAPLLQKWQTRKKVISINGQQSVTEVEAEITKSLQKANLLTI